MSIDIYFNRSYIIRNNTTLFNMIDKLVNINQLDKNSATVCSFACLINDVNSLKKAISLNANLNLANWYGYSLFMCCAQFDSIDCFKLLLSHCKIDINKTNNFNNNIWQVLIESDAIQCFTELISHLNLSKDEIIEIFISIRTNNKCKEFLRECLKKFTMLEIEEIFVPISGGHVGFYNIIFDYL